MLSLLCSLGLPKQMNLATSFLDGSNIYGNGIASEKKVRTYFNGELILDKYKEQNYSAINRCKVLLINFKYNYCRYNILVSLSVMLDNKLYLKYS